MLLHGPPAMKNEVVTTLRHGCPSGHASDAHLFLMTFIQVLLRSVFAGILMPALFFSTASVASVKDVLAGKEDAPAGTGAPSNGKIELTPEAVNARRASLQEEIVRARADFAKLAEGKQDETALWLTQEIALLERIDNLHAEQLRTLQHATDLEKESAEVADLTKNPRPPEVRLKPPYGFALLEQLYDQRDYLVEARALLKADVENATIALADARDELEENERARRSAREAAGNPAERTKAQGALRLAELESRYAQEAVILREKALKTLKFQQSLIEPKLALLLPDFDWLQQHLVLAEDDAKAADEKRKKRIEELDTAIASGRADADKAAQLVVAAERRGGGEQKTAGELESRRADRQTANLTLSVLAAQRERLTTFADVHALRLRVLAKQATPAEMKSWAAANEEELDRLEKIRRPQLAELRKSRRELQELQSRLADAAAEKRKEPWVSDRAGRLAAWVALNERELADLAELRTMRSRLKEELGERAGTFSWDDALTAGKANVVAGWNYEVFSVSDQPVRVKTLLAVIALIFAGHWVSRRASDMVGRTVFRRMGMNTGSRAAWQTLSFYALFLIVLLTAFNLFHLSLTQFSVVSGALAVGIGFGSQNLISNFISGIILLIERPVNQGDVIEIDGHQVTVERLGPRSTIVRSADNTHMVVPNSHLLEQNVINWTLSDDVIRKRIRVGVAYDSPTRDVARLMEEVLLSLEDVKRDPAPQVAFVDFGENALIFEASFWSCIGQQGQLETELRHRIAESFAKAGIMMAFPQRDVHLETTKPLQVELTQRGPASPAQQENRPA